MHGLLSRDAFATPLRRTCRVRDRRRPALRLLRRIRRPGPLVVARPLRLGDAARLPHAARVRPPRSAPPPPPPSGTPSASAAPSPSASAGLAAASADEILAQARQALLAAG